MGASRRTVLAAAGLGIASSVLPGATAAASTTGPQSVPTSGGSLSFDGGGGHVSIATTSTSDLTPGTGDYTVEWWMKEAADSTKGFPRIFALGNNLLTVSRENLAYQLVLIHGGAPIYPFAVGAPDGLKGTWRHVAVSRHQGVVRVYLQGTQVPTPSGFEVSMAANLANNSNQPFRLGVRESSPTTTSSENYRGLLTDFRYVIGQGLYTGSSLTVPTSPLPAVTGTAVLIRATTAETSLLDASGTGRTPTSVPIGASTVAWSSDSPYPPPAP